MIAAPVHSANPEVAPLLKLSNVSVRFNGQVVLRDISLDLKQGEFVCVVGPSGCGKTTLLRLMSALVRPSEGVVLFANQEMTRPTSDVAVVFQDYNRALLPWRTIEGNIMIALTARGVRGEAAKSIVRELLDKINLTEHAEKYPAQLSGGMQQRVQIARGLAQNPRILLMDEPFGALDAMTREDLQDEFGRLAMSDTRGIVFITHDIDEAILLGDRIIALDANPGRIVEEIVVDFPRPRDQLAIRDDRRFSEIRQRLHRHLRQSGRARR